MADDDMGEKPGAVDSMDVDDVDLPEELVHDEADRDMLLQMTELEREMELADRAEKQRREKERQRLMESTEVTGEAKGQTVLGKRSAERVGALEEESSDEELTFASQTGTPTVARDHLAKGEESASEKETDESDTGHKEAVENEADFVDYLGAQILRSDLERWVTEPHFEESILGCFIRFRGTPSANAAQVRDEYSLLEVTNSRIKEDMAPYKFGPGNRTTRIQLHLRRGGTEFWGNLNVISNSEFTMKEYEEWVQACKRHKRPLPSKLELEDRREQIAQARKFVFTHKEVKKILDEKRRHGSLKVGNVMMRATYMRYRDYYKDQQDTARVEEYEGKIRELEAKAEAQRKGLQSNAIDKQAAARKKQMKAETLESWIEQRRPKVMERFERKLERLPPERRPKALLKFYGPTHPLCRNIRESDVKRPSLEKSPSPDLEPILPKDIIMDADLERDLQNADEALRESLRNFADWTSQQSPDYFVRQQILNRWDGVTDEWQRRTRAKVAKGELKVVRQLSDSSGNA